MQKKMMILVFITILSTSLVCCSAGSKTPEDFVHKFFKEDDVEKFANYIVYPEHFYDEEGNIKEESKEDVKKQSELLNYVLSTTLADYVIENSETNEDVTIVHLDNVPCNIDAFLKPGDKGYKLYAGATFGLNDKLTFSKYIQEDEEMQQPYIIRVRAELDDYYDGYYSDKEFTHYSIKLKESMSSDVIFGYIDKKHGEELYNILKDGLEHNITLMVSMMSPKHSVVSVFEIESVISDSWLLPKNIEDEHIP
ncbi:hypothetical protein [Clostridium sp. ZS2-4]|uniref:hypothetical protein n=1 Tax=Clostridium sp. ZS2-4 TaxID=2987703 RepID=UPI00227B94C6|nr:hypothetical protein [Clostridium sp. ZS2-4]MCY6354364.1 hypothetical protein [Clostridium sp. ZS2-4]